MGVYYNFHVEILKNQQWHLLNNEEEIYVSSSIYYDFFNRYCIGVINCFELSESLINKYELRKKDNQEIEWFYRHNFFLMDIDMMFDNYNNDIHDYDGIISHQDYKKIKNRDINYPKIIDIKEVNKLPKRIKKNYGYYKWDDEISDYSYLYVIIPIIKKLISNMNYEEIRLIVYVD